MLTEQEVERTRSLVVRELDDYGDIAGLRKLSNQAIVAIDLAAENERLKAKLDAVRKWASNPVRIDDFGYQMAQESVLAIIDREEKYHAD